MNWPPNDSDWESLIERVPQKYRYLVGVISAWLLIDVLCASLDQLLDRGGIIHSIVTTGVAGPALLAILTWVSGWSPAIAEAMYRPVKWPVRLERRFIVMNRKTNLPVYSWAGRLLLAVPVMVICTGAWSLCVEIAQRTLFDQSWLMIKHWSVVWPCVYFQFVAMTASMSIVGLSMGTVVLFTGRIINIEIMTSFYETKLSSLR